MFPSDEISRIFAYKEDNRLRSRLIFLFFFKLDTPLTFNTKVAPIQLDWPRSGLAYPGKGVTVTGWGITEVRTLNSLFQ